MSDTRYVEFYTHLTLLDTLVSGQKIQYKYIQMVLRWKRIQILNIPTHTYITHTVHKLTNQPQLVHHFDSTTLTTHLSRKGGKVDTIVG